MVTNSLLQGHKPMLHLQPVVVPRVDASSLIDIGLYEINWIESSKNASKKAKEGLNSFDEEGAQ